VVVHIHHDFARCHLIKKFRDALAKLCKLRAPHGADPFDTSASTSSATATREGLAAE
jgi:hypothetical protein